MEASERVAEKVSAIGSAFDKIEARIAAIEKQRDHALRLLAAKEQECEELEQELEVARIAFEEKK